MIQDSTKYNQAIQKLKSSEQKQRTKIKTISSLRQKSNYKLYNPHLKQPNKKAQITSKMGNNNGNAISLAIIKKEGAKPYESHDYNKFFESKHLIISVEYETFEEFIQKQSLKTLHHILIVEGVDDMRNVDDDKKQQSDLANYMLPVKKLLDKKQPFANNISIRDKVINYIKKYSLQNLNLYFYVPKLKNFVVPQSQVPYITLVSNKASTIINHMLNEQSERLVNVKFKGLMKDLYRRKLVAVISKHWKDQIQNKINAEKDKAFLSYLQKLQKRQSSIRPKDTFEAKQKEKDKRVSKQQQKPQNLMGALFEALTDQESQLEKIIKEFSSPKNRFEYLFVDSIDKFRDKLKSMYFEFIICMDQQNLLQLIEFKKRMPVDSKIIYFGNKKDLQSQAGDQLLSSQASKVILQKKLNQIWWICDNIEEEICPVMKKWQINNYEIEKNFKISTNVIIYLCRTENIVRKKDIQTLIKQEIEEMSQRDFEERENLLKKMNLTVQFKPDAVAQRYQENLYTNVIMFDATNQEFQEMKKLTLSKFKGQPRLQVTVAEFKSKNTDKNSKNTEKAAKINDKNPDAQFIERIKSCIQKLELKFEISPIENVCCINIDDDDVEFFKNKMGLKVDIMGSIAKRQQYEKNKTSKNKDGVKKTLKSFEQFFPKYGIPSESRKYKSLVEISKILGANNPKLQIGSTFENFLIICNFDDYLRYLFPFLMMANFFKENFIFESKSQQKLKFDLLSQRDFLNVRNYLQKIKVVIYGQIDLSKKKKTQTYDLNKVLEFHQIDHSALNCIKETIYEFLDLPYIKSPEIELKLIKEGTQKKDNNRKVIDPEEITKYIEWVKKQVLQVKDPKNLLRNEGETQIKIVFPNIVFVHNKLSEIEEYLNFYKYNKLSIQNFPKDSLKNFFKAHQKIETIFVSKSFSLDATFVSSNNLLKEVFEKKNIQVSPKHKMDFIRFSSNKQSELTSFEEYIKKYAGLWKIKFDLFKKDGESKLVGQKAGESFKLLKNDVKRAFQKCKNYELLKITTTQFKHFYIDRIQKCQTLLDLQIAAIYIYSLPHGVSEIVSVIFEDPTKSALSLQIFNSFLFLLFANFYSVESRTLQKISTVIYVNEEKIRNIYQQFRQNQIIVNQNILHILNDENETENEKNHCVFIEYENVPWLKRSSLTPILKIQNFAFYKESAEFILAPFTKLKLRQKKFVNKQYYKLYFEVITDYDSNIFLKTFFELNSITDIAIFNALDYRNETREKIMKQKDAQMRDDDIERALQEPQQTFQASINNQSKQLKKNMPKSSTSLTQTKQRIQPQKPLQNKNPKPQPQSQEFSSLYRQAQQTSLKEQKEIVRQSIRLILSYMSMLYSMKNGKIFSAEKYFYQIYAKTLDQLNDNDENDRKYEEIKEEFELHKLRIEKAMLYAKMNDYSKAIEELDQLLSFLKYEKVEQNSKGSWMKTKIIEMKLYISNMQKIRQTQINEIKQIKKWTIAMEDNHDRNITQTVVYNPACKWKVKFYDLQETFIMENTNDMIEPQKYNVFSNYLTPEMAKAQAAVKAQEKDKKKQQEQQQKSSEPSFSLGDLLFELFDADAKQNDDLDVRGKGSMIEQDITKMNTLFESMIKTKQLRLLKLIHVYIKFWDQIVNNFSSNAMVWKKIKQISQTYLMEKFLYLAEEAFFEFKPSERRTIRAEEWFRDFLIYFERKFTKQKIASIRQQLLEEHLERQDNAKQSQNITINGSTGKKCWIDEGLEFHNQRMDWSVFEFDGRMIAVDAKRKWKQNVNNGLNLAGKTFVRADNDVLNLDKTKKSRIDPNN